MLILLLLLYVALSYVYPGELFPALRPYRITFLVGIISLLVSVLWLVMKQSRALGAVQLWFLAAFTLTVVVSKQYAEQWLGAVVPALTSFGPSIAMFLLTIASVDSIRKIRLVAGTIALLSLALVVQGGAAYHFGINPDMFLFDPVTRAEYVAGVEPTDELFQQTYEPPPQEEDESLALEPIDTQVRIRGLGLFHDPNDLALGLVVALPLLRAWAAPGLTSIVLVGIPALTLIYGIFMTHSRGGAVALMVTVGALFARRLGRTAAVVTVALLVAGAVAAGFGGGRQLSGADDAALGRFNSWVEGFEMLKMQPVLGVGYGQFLEHHTLTAHNSMVLCFAETGLIGYFFWLGFIVITFQQLRHLQQNATAERDADICRWATTLQFALIGFLTAAMFLSRTFIPLLYLLIGLGVALVLMARQRGLPVWNPSLPALGGIVLACEVASILMIYVIIKLYLA